jgi:hypothetical protein
LQSLQSFDDDTEQAQQCGEAEQGGVGPEPAWATLLLDRLSAPMLLGTASTFVASTALKSRLPKRTGLSFAATDDLTVRPL